MGRTTLRGFTLIELLVVVAIIAGLIAILIPSLSKVRQNAYKVKCQTNLRSLAYLDSLYASEYSGYVPRNSGTILGLNVPSYMYLLSVMNGLKPYNGYAPGVTPPGGFEAGYSLFYSKMKWLNCPSFPKADQPVCFVTNGFDPANPGTDVPFFNLKRIFRLGEVINFTEANSNQPNDNYEIYDLWSPLQILPNTTTTTNVSGSTAGRISSDKRHGIHINASYYDGHVEAKVLSKIIQRDFTGR